ncbi:MAG TPA: ThuA domain-containing protein [Pirellulales bacterium]|nr:ThuA domain-containing protein [Pirellulales bacterium]
MVLARYIAWVSFLLVLQAGHLAGADDAPRRRLLLLGQAPDGHPRTTHEYLPGLRILEFCLKQVPEWEVQLEHADEPWAEGPAKLGQADGCVLFLSEGAKWANADPRRYEALTRLAARGGGLVGLHWGIGAKDAEHIEPYLRLLGGCHGGPDRRYTVIETQWQLAGAGHPITTGLKPALQVRDEFYFRLKLAQPADAIEPLIRVPIEGRDETVAWAWQRGDGGRSFGFSGLHFHDNWRHESYRRLVSQAVLWTLKLRVPDGGLPVDVPDELLDLSR